MARAKRLSKQPYLLAVVLFVIIVGFVISFRRVTDTSTATLSLLGLPGAYCPAKAQVLVYQSAKLAQESSASPLKAGEVAVRDCQRLALNELITSNTAGEYTVFIKLPQGLAFERVINWPSTDELSQFIRVGDTNSDNLINQADTRAVEQRLFQTATPTTAEDLNRDGQISVIDWNLTKINQGVGSNRPDGKAWEIN